MDMSKQTIIEEIEEEWQDEVVIFLMRAAVLDCILRYMVHGYTKREVPVMEAHVK